MKLTVHVGRCVSGMLSLPLKKPLIVTVGVYVPTAYIDVMITYICLTVAVQFQKR